MFVIGVRPRISQRIRLGQHIASHVVTGIRIAGHFNDPDPIGNQVALRTWSIEHHFQRVTGQRDRREPLPGPLPANHVCIDLPLVNHRRLDQHHIICHQAEPRLIDIAHVRIPRCQHLVGRPPI